MLEGVLVVRHIIIIVVRIGEEGITVGEDIRSAQIRSRQLCLVGLLDGEYFLGIIRQVMITLKSLWASRLNSSASTEWRSQLRVMLR